MKEKKLTGKRINRRTFLKVSGAVGLGVTATTFGVPTLLRAAPSPIKIGSIQPATGPLAVIGQGQRRETSWPLIISIQWAASSPWAGPSWNLC